MSARHQQHLKYHTNINNDIFLRGLPLIIECLGKDGCTLPLPCQAASEISLQDPVSLHIRLGRCTWFSSQAALHKPMLVPISFSFQQYLFLYDMDDHGTYNNFSLVSFSSSFQSTVFSAVCQFVSLRNTWGVIILCPNEFPAASK